MLGTKGCSAADVPSMVVYVSGSMDLFISLRACIALRDERRMEGWSMRGGLEKRSGAGRSNLPSVSLEPARKRPCRSTVSLRAKEDDRWHSIRTTPAFIAGEIVDLDVAINPGGAVRIN